MYLVAVKVLLVQVVLLFLSKPCFPCKYSDYYYFGDFLFLSVLLSVIHGRSL